MITSSTVTTIIISERIKTISNILNSFGALEYVNAKKSAVTSGIIRYFVVGDEVTVNPSV